MLEQVSKIRFNLAESWRLAKEGTWVVAGQVTSVIGSLVLVRVLTEKLDPVQYGELTLGLTLAGLVNQVVMGGVSAGLVRFYAIAFEKNDLHGYLKTSCRLMTYATAAVVLLGSVLMSCLLWLGYRQWILLSAAVLALSVLNGFNSSLSGIQNAARQRAVVAFHGGLDACLKILIVTGVILWLGSSGAVVVMGYALSLLLVTGSQLFFLRRLVGPRHPKSTPSSDWGHEIWKYSWPFSAWGFFTWFQQVSDRWALQGFASTQDVGLYAVVFQLGYAPISLVIGMAMNFLGPILYQRSGNATDHTRNTSVHRVAWRITFIILLITALAFFLTLMLHGWIFQLLVAGQYHSVSRFLPWMVLAGGIFAAGQMLALKLMSEMKSAVMAVAKIATAVFGVGLNIFGASQFGLTGLVGAIVVFSGIYFLWMAWLAQLPPAACGHLVRTS